MPAPNQPTAPLALAHTLARSIAIALAILAVLPACASRNATQADRPASPRHQAARDLMAHIMNGSYSSAAQAQADPDNFFDIRLHMTPIWPHRTDALWVYVEQATAARQDRPYRQRVYRITWTTDTTAESAVFVIPGDPLAFAGAHADPARFNILAPENLIPRDGCTVFLEYEHAERRFIGGTRGTTCQSDLAGAAYATSTAVMDERALLTWDRGWSADGAQVWGATTGGYEFLRIDN